jgi:hypothetical protein
MADDSQRIRALEMKLTCGDPSDATDPTQLSRGYIGTKVFGVTYI